MPQNEKSPADLQPNDCHFTTALEEFKKGVKLSADEESLFKLTKLEDLRIFIRDLQEEQCRQRRMSYLKRLEPFLKTMEEYGKVIEVFVNASDIVAFIWGPMKYILLVASTFSEAFNSVLDAYEQIGEEIPLLADYEKLFSSSNHMKSILVMIYKDILEFHKEAMRHFKQKLWKQLFRATWRGFLLKIDHMKQSMRRHKSLIDSRATIMQFEEVQKLQYDSNVSLKLALDAQQERKLQKVKQWLTCFSCEAQQDVHRATRATCSDSGRWLLECGRFQKWYSSQDYTSSMLWICGKPGAGKTILSSVIVDEVSKMKDTSMAFFYCKHGDIMRNSLVSIVRALLSQLLVHNMTLLPYLHEKASLSSDVILSSREIAKEILKTVVNSCEKVFIILDGLDECGRDDRKEIALQFQELVNGATEIGSVKCLFVSQDDGISRKDLADIPSIQVTMADTQSDIASYVAAWKVELENKFGELESSKKAFEAIVDKAEGIFLFAKLMMQHLESQVSRASLLRELSPERTPVKLDDVYNRILERIVVPTNTGDRLLKMPQVLGWIASSARSLRWREVQGAIIVDLDRQHIDMDKKMLESPKELFASLVEVHADGTVELIHETLREYLIRKKVITIHQPDYELCSLSLAYLSFPIVELGRSNNLIIEDFKGGAYAFYDYSTACWLSHLMNCLPHLQKDQEEVQVILSHEEMQETLEVFIETRWTSRSVPKVRVPKSVEKAISTMKCSDSYDKIAQAMIQAKRQLHAQGQDLAEDEPLDIWKVTQEIRSSYESLDLSLLTETERKTITQLYGTNLFKCPRVNCYFYHDGFSSSRLRDSHVLKHERPFLCLVEGCYKADFGCTTEDELKKHLFLYHGIDIMEDNEFPTPAEEKKEDVSTGPGKYECRDCGKKFTRRHNLNAHSRSHANVRSFECRICSQRFIRKSDCVRHEKGHESKGFLCGGTLDDGSTWGCKAAFSRADKRAMHFKSKKGQACIKPFMAQELKKRRDTTDEDMEQDTGFTEASRCLPSFEEFLSLCGLDGGSIGTEEDSRKASPGGSFVDDQI